MIKGIYLGLFKLNGEGKLIDMFFGKESSQREIIEAAQKVAKEKNMLLVYGATMGSISRGIQSYDSDYDLRFLYLDKNFPERKYMPDLCKEEEIVYRYEPNNPELFYDRIAFWEFSSFLQYLIKPSIDGIFSRDYGLYYIVEHTFFSPFTWDPYGLQWKYKQLLENIYSKKWGIQYNLGVINKFFYEREIRLKDYIYCAISAMSIEFIMRYNRPAPIHIQTLMAVMDNYEVTKCVEELIDEMNIKSGVYLEVSDKHYIHGTHFNVYSNRNVLLDNYIKNLVADAERFLMEKKCRDILTNDQKEATVQKMYRILEKSLNEVIVRGVND